jgi:predicted kinase
MSVKKIVEQLQERVDESMDTVEAVKGEDFRNLLAFVMGCSQAMRLMAQVMKNHEDDHLIEACGKQIAHVLAKGSSMIADAYKFDEEQVQELMKWVDTLDSHVANAIKEAQND